MTIFRKISVSLLLIVGGFTSSFSYALESTSTKLADSKVLAGSGLADPNMTGSLIQTTLGLLVVLAIIGGAAWGFKRFGNFQTGVQGKLKVVGGISLSTRERVVLLQVGDQQLVVGVTPGHIQTLHVLDEPLQMENENQQNSGFSAKLQSAMANHTINKKVNKDSAPSKLEGES